MSFENPESFPHRKSLKEYKVEDLEYELSSLKEELAVEVLGGSTESKLQDTEEKINELQKEINRRIIQN